ncbi:MAG: hypothetical protein Q4D90_00955 [bacterium]|nr:hypothetical protein [bacterium]
MRRQGRKQQRRGKAAALTLGFALLLGSFASFGAQSDSLLSEIQSVTGADSMKEGVPKNSSYSLTVKEEEETVASFAQERVSGSVVRTQEGQSANEGAEGPAKVQETLAAEAMETESEVGPTVREVTLSETYHDEYEIYTESIDGRYFIYSNIGNNGMTDGPVSLDIPQNVSYTVEKDGAAFSYTSGQSLTENGTYIFYFTAVKDASQPLSRQVIYEATFHFRIQPKPPSKELESMAESLAGNNSFSTNSQFHSQTNSQTSPAISFEEGTQETQTLPEESTEAVEFQDNTAESRPAESEAEAVTEASQEGEEAEGETTPSIEISGGAKRMPYTQSYEQASGMYRISLSNEEYFYSNVPNGMLTNVGVTLEISRLGIDSSDITVLRNGESYALPTNLMFTETGSYLLRIPKNGKMAIYSFYILGRASADLDGYTLPEGMTLTFASRDGENLPVESLFLDGTGQRLQWEEDGRYQLTFVNPEGIHSEVEVAIDREAPLFEVSVNNSVASITYQSSDVERVIVRNGNQESTYSRIDRLSEAGSYTIEVYDYAGNKNVKNVVIPKKVNVAGILAVVLAVALIAAGVAVFVKTKKNFQVK